MPKGGGAISYSVANLFGSEKDTEVEKDYLILKRAFGWPSHRRME
jgi:hypothetical protein